MEQLRKRDHVRACDSGRGWGRLYHIVVFIVIMVNDPLFRRYLFVLMLE